MTEVYGNFWITTIPVTNLLNIVCRIWLLNKKIESQSYIQSVFRIGICQSEEMLLILTLYPQLNGASWGEVPWVRICALESQKKCTSSNRGRGRVQHGTSTVDQAGGETFTCGNSTCEPNRGETFTCTQAQMQALATSPVEASIIVAFSQMMTIPLQKTYYFNSGRSWELFRLNSSHTTSNIKNSKQTTYDSIKLVISVNAGQACLYDNSCP